MLRLVTIPMSHYCEKARWALDRAGLAYREEPHLQGFHYAYVRAAGGGITAPVLVTADGVLSDSSAILEWVDRTRPRGLYPREPATAREVRAWEEDFDEGLGPASRLVVYHHLLPWPELSIPYAAASVPWWQRRLFPTVFPVVAGFIERRLGIDDAGLSDAHDTIDRTLGDVAARLADGRRYLAGESFTAADLTFAALAAPLVLPPGYGIALPRLEELPATLLGLVTRWRQHPAGAFALRLYEDDR